MQGSAESAAGLAPTAVAPSAPPPATRGASDWDCLGCRATGLLLGVGGGGYLASRLLVAPTPTGAHRAAIVALSGVIFLLGVGRAFAPADRGSTA